MAAIFAALLAILTFSGQNSPEFTGEAIFRFISTNTGESRFVERPGDFIGLEWYSPIDGERLYSGYVWTSGERFLQTGP